MAGRQLAHYLDTQPVMKVLKSLSARPRHLRNLAAEHKISLGGVSDVMRRLKRAGLVRDFRSGNRRYFSLVLQEADLKWFNNYLLVLQNDALEKRAARFSKNAAAKLQWMDDAYRFYREISRKSR